LAGLEELDAARHRADIRGAAHGLYLDPAACRPDVDGAVPASAGDVRGGGLDSCPRTVGHGDRDVQVLAPPAERALGDLADHQVPVGVVDADIVGELVGVIVARRAVRPAL